MSQRKRWRHKGRSDGASFIQVPHYVLQSPEWAALDGNAIKALMELAGQYKGSNNGDLSAPFTTAKERGWGSETTLTKWRKVLQDRGGIIETRKGGRHIGCSLFAVTWWPVDASHKHQEPATRTPPNTWKKIGLGTPKNGVQCLQKMESERVKLQKLECENGEKPEKVVSLRPAA